MLNITREQALQRWDTLPETIKEAMYEPVVITAVQSVAGNYGIADEISLREIETIAGDVFMGFLRNDTYEIAREISERIGLPNDRATKAANDLRKKAFAQFQDEIEKIYAPLETANESASEPSRTATAELPKESPMPASLDQGPPPQTKEQETPKEEVVEETPFMLHSEAPTFTPAMPVEKPSVKFEPKAERVRVTVQSSKARVEAPEPTESARVVHYNNMRTPLEKN
jgi:hypothetical protein